MSPTRIFLIGVLFLLVLPACTQKSPSDTAPEVRPQKHVKKKTTQGNSTIKVPLAEAPKDCSESPLIGHFIWNIGNCESGSVEPLGADCKTRFAYENQPRKYEVHFQDQTLYLPAARNAVEKLTLTREFQCPEEKDLHAWVHAGLSADIARKSPSNWKEETQRLCTLLQRLVASNENIYLGMEEGQAMPQPGRIFYITDKPWTSAKDIIFSELFAGLHPDSIDKIREQWKRDQEAKEKGSGCDHGGEHQH